MELQVTPPVIVALRISGPAHIADAEGIEQFPAREAQRIGAGRFGNEGGKQVTIGVTVSEAHTSLANHGKVERELRPIRALPHLAESRIDINVRVVDR